MQIVIDISEKDFKAVQKTVFTIDEMYETLNGRVYCAVAGGIVLPKPKKEVGCNENSD